MVSAFSSAARVDEMPAYGSLERLGMRKLKKKPVLVLDADELARAYELFQIDAAERLNAMDEEEYRPRTASILNLVPIQTGEQLEADEAEAAPLPPIPPFVPEPDDLDGEAVEDYAPAPVEEAARAAPATPEQPLAAADPSTMAPAGPPFAEAPAAPEDRCPPPGAPVPPAGQTQTDWPGPGADTPLPLPESSSVDHPAAPPPSLTSSPAVPELDLASDCGWAEISDDDDGIATPPSPEALAQDWQEPAPRALPEDFGEPAAHNQLRARLVRENTSLARRRPGLLARIRAWLGQFLRGS